MTKQCAPSKKQTFAACAEAINSTAVSPISDKTMESIRRPNFSRSEIVDFSAVSCFHENHEGEYRANRRVDGAEAVLGSSSISTTARIKTEVKMARSVQEEDCFMKTKTSGGPL